MAHRSTETAAIRRWPKAPVIIRRIVHVAAVVVCHVHVMSEVVSSLHLSIGEHFATLRVRSIVGRSASPTEIARLASIAVKRVVAAVVFV